VLKIIGELLSLIKWLISTNKAERFREDVEDIKSDPSGSWSERFGRVRPDQGSSSDRVEPHSSSSELPTGDSETPWCERKLWQVNTTGSR
jgi:hypothetical protein